MLKSVHEIDYSNIVIDKKNGRWSDDTIYSELENMFYQIYIHWYYNEYIIEGGLNPVLSQNYFMSYMNTIKYTNKKDSYYNYYKNATHILRKLKLEKLKNGG